MDSVPQTEREAAQFTPGPYFVHRDENETVTLLTGTGGMELLTIRLSDSTETGGEDEEDDARFNAEMMANAHLFAAATEMFAALEMALKFIEHGNFANGCTNPDGSLDEGEVRANRFHDEVAAIIRKAKGQAHE